jgi:predicted cupin superfamily sugar epimerase
MALDAAGVAQLLDMQPHPEGGYYRQTFADAPGPDGRAKSTLIYYMLQDRQKGAWHRVDAAEVWHYYSGAPMVVRISLDGVSVTEHRLGADLLAGERPQVVVPPGAWQQAEVLGDWGLVGCTVAPGFEFRFFEQRNDWAPGDGA